MERESGTPLAPSGRQLGSNRRRDIQGLRAFAVLFVVCFHAGLPVPGGFTGVDVFFVISGFVITSMLAREWAATGRIQLRAFYARRFRRLAPALALMVAVTVLISAVAVSPFQGQQNTAKTALGATLLFANVAIARTTGGYFDAATDTNPLLNTWSLSVEEQFYLFFPVVLLLGWWLARRYRVLRSAPVLSALIATGVSFAVAVIASRQYQVPHSAIIGFYSPMTRAWEFGAGAILAFVGSRVRVSSRPVSGALAVAGLVMLGTSLRVISGSTPFPGTATLIPVVGSLLLIAAGFQPDNLISRTLASRPLVAIGDLSYSWYLWHWPLIVFSALLWPGSGRLATMSAAAFSLVPATASYRWVEQPIRNLRGVTRYRMTRIVALTVLPPIALAMLLLVSVHHGFWSPRIRTLEAAVMPLHAGVMTGRCAYGAVPDQPALHECEWNVGAQGPPLYLIGDSNAEQFSEAVIGAGQRLHRPVTISTSDGCAFLDASLSNESDAKEQQCRGYFLGTRRWLSHASPGVVIIGMSESLWIDDTAVGPTRRTESSDHRRKVQYLEANLLSVVRRLKRGGQRVLLLQPVPKPWKVVNGKIHELFNPEGCSTLAVIRSRCPKVVETPRSLTNRMQADARRTIRKVAVETGAGVLDLQAYFCPHGMCSTQRGNLVLYRDGGHITVHISETLAKTFADAITRLAAKRK